MLDQSSYLAKPMQKMLHAASRGWMAPVHTAHRQPWQDRDKSPTGRRSQVKVPWEVCVRQLRSHKDRREKSTYMQTGLLALGCR